ncbi:MAG: hypothetical protein ACYS8W_13335 [Planctomycetota bacterium]
MLSRLGNALRWAFGQKPVKEGGFPWFIQKVTSLFIILIPFIAVAFFIRNFSGLDRFQGEHRLDRLFHEYIDIPVTTWTTRGVFYITGTPVSVRRHEWRGERGAPNLDTIYNDEKSLWIGPSCTARKHVFLIIAFSLAFPLLTCSRRILLAVVTTAFTILLSAIRIRVLFFLAPSGSEDIASRQISHAYFEAIHNIDGYLIAAASLGFWIILAMRLAPTAEEHETAGDETILDNTPKTVTEKASEIKQ